MGLRTLMRTTAIAATATVVAALLTAPSATAHNCANCEDPELPDPGGPNCPTIVATTMPSRPTPSTPKVNAEVTASTGVWNSNTKRLLAIWYVDTAAARPSIPLNSRDQKTLSFTPTADELGKPIRLYVRGIGANTACFKGEYSEATSDVTSGDAPAATTAPSILGNLAVGTTVEADPGVWNMPTDSLHFVWSWENGILRGAGSNYVLTPDDRGKRMRLDVIADRAGHHQGSSTTISTTAVAKGPTLQATTSPTVSGNPVYGETLSVTDGTWTPAATDVEHEWLRDGKAIPGAKAATYRPGLNDIGSRLSVRVSAERVGHSAGSTTVQVGKVKRAAAPKWTGKKVGLQGKNKVKKKVRAALGVKKIRKRASASGAKVTFQWLRNGKKIKKSTKRVHQIVKADRKKKLKVRIKIAQPGHKPLVITTKAVKIKNNGKKIK